MNLYRFIEAEKAQQRNLQAGEPCCWRPPGPPPRPHAATPSARQRTDTELTEHIRQAHQASKGRYGASRIHAELL